MDNKDKENAITKKIYEVFSSSLPENIKRDISAINIYSKNLTLSLKEESENKNLENIESNKEYKLGDYIIKYTLGKGAFGKVKLGISIPNHRKVAIKILKKSKIVEKDDVIRIKREFDMLSKFNHPNVILVAEIFESEYSFYTVMEFCEEGELFNYIVKKSHLCEEESAFFFYQLINGLEYIHSLGIVHRDLKPENLLLTKDHILKIIDFGLSNYFKENQEQLLSTLCGSPCYASPEMVAGKNYNGFKVDIWSCGIVLYAMLCGYLPFEDRDNRILFKKILKCKLEFPKYVKEMGKDLIKKILVVDPEKRIIIKEIKNHPFYLKGKYIFEQEFFITKAIINPKKNNNNNEISKENKENINNSKENINENNKNSFKLLEINKSNVENIKEDKKIIDLVQKEENVEDKIDKEKEVKKVRKKIKKK